MTKYIKVNCESLEEFIQTIRLYFKNLQIHTHDEYCVLYEKNKSNGEIFLTFREKNNHKFVNSEFLPSISLKINDAVIFFTPEWDSRKYHFLITVGYKNIQFEKISIVLPTAKIKENYDFIKWIYQNIQDVVEHNMVLTNWVFIFRKEKPNIPFYDLNIFKNCIMSRKNKKQLEPILVKDIQSLYNFFETETKITIKIKEMPFNIKIFPKTKYITIDGIFYLNFSQDISFSAFLNLYNINRSVLLEKIKKLNVIQFISDSKEEIVEIEL